MKFTIGKLAATGVVVATAAAIAMPAQAADELKVSTALGQKHDQRGLQIARFRRVRRAESGRQPSRRPAHLWTERSRQVLGPIKVSRRGMGYPEKHVRDGSGVFRGLLSTAC